MLTIYGHSISSRVNKVKMGAKALGLEYQEKTIDVTKNEQSSPEFKKISASGKIPAIDDGGFTLFESNAILKYLARKTESTWYPSDIQTQATIDQWLDYISHHVDNHVTSLVLNTVFFPKMGVEVDTMALKEKPGFVGRALTVIDTQLGQTDYLTGNTPTIADIALIASLDPVAMLSQLKTSDYPNLTRWQTSITATDWYKDVHTEYEQTMKQAA